MIKKMDTKYTDIGCLDIPKLWYTYRKNVEMRGIIVEQIKQQEILPQVSIQREHWHV